MTAALAVQDLRKTYQSGLEALKGISFDVQPGDFLALLGPNGAGKSTTIGILSSLVLKTSGSVRIFGYDLDTQLSDAKQQLGVVPQEFNFNHFEKVGNILRTQAGYFGLDRRTAQARCDHYLKLLGLWDKRNDVSRLLSGGMKRRLMIARALVHEPRLLILDEPTAGVDIELRRSLWALLQDLNRQGTTIILTTHYLEEAEQLCRSIAIIDQGSIIEHSSMKALLKRLDQETFLLDVQVVPAVLPTLPNGKLVPRDEHTLELTMSRGSSLNQAFAALSGAGIEVRSLRNKSNRLEELFVSLVAAQGR